MAYLKQAFQKSKHILLYGAVMGILVLILKWMQWQYVIRDNSLDIYIGLIALFFTSLGIWVATQLTRPKIKTVIIEKEILIVPAENFKIDEAELRKLNLSTREYEVLELLVKGKTNAEIAEQLFLSLSTIKTHVSNLFVKMDVKNRTQAMEKAKRLKITL